MCIKNNQFLLVDLTTAHVSGVIGVLIVIVVMIDAFNEVALTLAIPAHKIYMRKFFLFVHKKIDHIFFLFQQGLDGVDRRKIVHLIVVQHQMDLIGNQSHLYRDMMTDISES